MCHNTKNDAHIWTDCFKNAKSYSGFIGLSCFIDVLFDSLLSYTDLYNFLACYTYYRIIFTQ